MRQLYLKNFLIKPTHYDIKLKRNQRKKKETCFLDYYNVQIVEKHCLYIQVIRNGTLFVVLLIEVLEKLIVQLIILDMKSYMIMY